MIGSVEGKGTVNSLKGTLVPSIDINTGLQTLDLSR